MFFMLRVTDRFKEIAVAPDPTAVFGWAGLFTFQAKRVFGFGIDCRGSLEQDLVFPAVAEIVLVIEGESFAGRGQDLTEVGLRGIDALEVLEPVIQQVGITVALALDFELMQMAVGPAHRCLDMFVEFVERAVLHLDSSPDRRLGTEQRDFKLVNSVGQLGLLSRDDGWYGGNHVDLQTVGELLGDEQPLQPLQWLAFQQRFSQGQDDGGGVGRRSALATWSYLASADGTDETSAISKLTSACPIDCS